jgi:TPR repeat protein
MVLQNNSHHKHLKKLSAAVKWYRKAAEQGYAKAQLELGVMYSNGIGVIQDKVMAHMYWNLASINGKERAGIYRDSIAKGMTPSQIEKAQALAREWMRTH